MTSPSIPKKEDLDLYVSSQLGLSRHAVVAMAYDQSSRSANFYKGGEIRVFVYSVEVVFEFKLGQLLQFASFL